MQKPAGAYPRPCLPATPPVGGVLILVFVATQGAAADAALPWASVLTAPPVGGAQKYRSKLFPNHREAKRGWCSGNEIRLRRTISTPAAWTISRLCRDDILPRSGQRPDIVCRRQISSAQSADIVLTAGQDIVHQKHPGRLFPNDREVKRGCCPGNDIRLRRTISTPAAWTISRLCHDDILPVVGRWPISS